MDKQEHEPLPFLNNGIAQVAILVPDLMAAIKHYHEDFGIGPWDIYTYQKPLVSQMTYHGKPADYAMRIGLSYLGPMRVELIQPLRGESVYADHIAEHGYGLHHFGLLVEDMACGPGRSQSGRVRDDHGRRRVWPGWRRSLRLSRHRRPAGRNL